MTRAITLRTLARIAAALALGTALAALAAGTPAGQEDPRDRPYPHGDWSEDCGLCHDEEKFLPARPTKDFRHGAALPLRGAHATAACSACHETLDFTKPPKPDCVSCHQDAHRGEFGMDCGRCHTPRTFLDRAEMARVHRTTRFPLSGAHAAADCEGCHRPVPQGHLAYVGLATECEACHDSPAFPSAPQRPASHVEGTYPLDCSACHNTVDFSIVRFDHATTSFPLTGAHVGLACTACHADGVYDGKPTECVSCHQADYDATTDPGHSAAGFGTDCALCHTTTTFDGARFPEHDASYFPIYSGSHAGVWSACSDCHTNSANYTVFSCLGCHSQADTNPIHGGVPGYSYDSAACYACHPRGVPED